MARLPGLYARGESIPEAWENSLLVLHEHGLRYKRDDPDDAGGEQIGARMLIEITNPDHPLITHKCESGQTSGGYGLFEYIMEILGVKDTWRRDLTDKGDTRWEYTYHARLSEYPTGKGPFDQIQFMVDRLVERPYSRRVNAITWFPEVDCVQRHTPCLQRITCEEVLNYDQGKTSDMNMACVSDLVAACAEDEDVLNVTYDMRSRNVVHAAPDNMKGFYVGLMCRMTDEIRRRSGRNVRNGSLIEFTDNYHVSPRDRSKFEGAVKIIKESRAKGEGIEQRAYTKEFMAEIMLEEKNRLVEQLIDQARKYAPRAKFDAEVAKITALAEQVIPMLLRKAS